MVAWDGAGSVFGLAMRATRLGSDGAPLVGVTGNSLVTAAFTKIDITPVYQEGTEVSELNAQGAVCLSYQGEDSLTHYTVAIEVCSVAPELMELLSAGAVLLDGADVVGYSSPPVGSTGAAPNGIGIEAWSRAVLDGGPATVDPYLHWLMPRVRKLKRTGVTTIGGEAVKGTFEGIAVGNPAWGDGPTADSWPVDDLDSDMPYQYRRVSTIPTVANAYAAVVADA